MPTQADTRSELTVNMDACRLYVMYTMMASYWWSIMEDNMTGKHDEIYRARAIWNDRRALAALENVPADVARIAHTMYDTAYRAGKRAIDLLR
jgi:hypothetical protein